MRSFARCTFVLLTSLGLFAPPVAMASYLITEAPLEPDETIVETDARDASCGPSTDNAGGDLEVVAGVVDHDVPPVHGASAVSAGVVGQDLGP